MEIFWKYTGIAFWTFLAFWLIMHLIFGKNWWLKLTGKALIGQGLIDSGKQLISEVRNREIKDETIAKVGAHVLWRFTRIGVFALFIALIPFLLLYQQNGLIKGQNDLIQGQNKLVQRQAIQDSLQTELLIRQNILFKDQNEKVDSQMILLKNQNHLFAEQNEKVTIQTDLLGQQTGLSKEQNMLVRAQNSRLDTQNYRLNLQNNLIEAERRGSLVILMSDIMNQMNAEINRQKEKETFNNSLGYALSDPLIGRIGALSQGFLPYRFLEGDTLTTKAVSPERGQLLQALVNSKLDSITLDKIYEISNFNNAYLVKANLREADLRGADLREADLRGADLRGADLRETDLGGTSLRMADLGGTDLRMANLHVVDLSGAFLGKAFLGGAFLRMADLRRTNLHGADLYFADLIGADLRGANLSGAYLRVANLSGAYLGETNLRKADLCRADLLEIKNFTISQLIKTKNLYQSKNLDPKIKAQLEKEKPCLFTEEGCKDNN